MEHHDHLLTDLNEQQRAAVLATEGPVLVIAGAGSGKTRVLTRRAAWIIRSLGVRPDEVVAVTFTNKAAEEMKGRIGSLLGGEPAGIRMGTFHSLCLRILRTEAASLGYRRDFVVYDTADQTAVMKEVVEDLRLPSETHPPRALLHRISAARNRFVTPHEIDAALADAGGDLLVQARQVYARMLRAANAMDFDDLILNVLELFRERPDLEQRLRERTRYLLVDEYQDTNRPQYVLIRALAAGHGNLCVVGDDSQSIYRFRGADIGNILRFEEDYPDALTIKLTRNYRSTRRILEVAGNVIRRNRGRIEKELWTENQHGEQVTFLQAMSDRDEADFVAGQIVALRRHPAGCELTDMAVLYRTNAQSRLLEESLMRLRVPYRIYGGLRFYDRKEIKDLMAYLRLVANPSDDVSLRRVLNVPPRGLGKVTLDVLEESARAEGTSLHAAVEKLAAESPPSRAARPLRALVDLLADLRARAAGGEPASTLIADLARRLDYEAYLRKNEPGDVESRIENIQQLIAAAQEREAAGEPELAAFLDGAALVAEVESATGAAGGVNLMTLHCAKGLEFGTVFLVGMEENVFPHARSMMAADDQEIEEERRLCYVGMTRAKERLFLTCARQRRAFGTLTANEPSRFISEAGPGMLRDLSVDWFGASEGRWREGRAGPPSRPAPSLGDEDVSVHPEEETPPRDAGLRVGMKVYHEQFGYGEVERLEGRGEKQKATVRFSGWGRRKLMTWYANLQRVAR